MAMSAEITRQNIATSNVISPVGAEVVHDVQGRYRGETVQLASDTSKLTDEAEEIGMAIASRADRRSLGQRDIRAGRGNNPEGLAKTRGSYEKLPDMPKEAELASLIDLLTSFQEALASGRSEGGPTKEDVLAALHAFDPDVTHQFEALEVAREHFEAAGASPDIMMLLDGAKAEFEKTDIARDVKAGFAVAEVASRAAATLESDPATVRNVYRGMLRDTMNIGQIFDALRGFDPLKNLGETVEVFMTAAGRDLASTGPSSDPLFLHGLLSELGKLKKVQTTLEATKSLIYLTERGLRPADRGPVDIEDQASRILNFASQPSAGPADAQRMLGQFGSKSLGVQLVYTNGLRELHGDIPDEVMPSPQARLQQSAAIVSLLDRLVADEEREFLSRGVA